MSLVSSNTLINKLDDTINKLHASKSMEPQKIELFIIKLNELIAYQDSLMNLDLSLKEYMEITKKKNEIIYNYDFQAKMESIPDDSLTIYVAKAQIYKVYNHDDLDDFQNDNNTHFRKPEWGPVYEVVRDKNPQKLTIVIKDGVLTDKLHDIKTNIVEFVKKNPEFSDIKTSDLTVFNSDNNTEFLVGSLRMANISEKEKLIERFIKYMRTKGETEIASKIEIRTPPCDELDGARLYKLPSLKIQLSGATNNLIDQLVTTTVPSTSNSVVVHNTFIIQNNSNNITNSNNTTTNNIVSEKKSLSNFYKYIFNNKPAWYIENTYVSIDIIETAYRTYFEDQETTTSVISRQLNGDMFSNTTRINRVIKKKLVSYDKLKKLF